MIEDFVCHHPLGSHEALSFMDVETPLRNCMKCIKDEQTKLAGKFKLGISDFMERRRIVNECFKDSTKNFSVVSCVATEMKKMMDPVADTSQQIQISNKCGSKCIPMFTRGLWQQVMAQTKEKDQGCVVVVNLPTCEANNPNCIPKSCKGVNPEECMRRTFIEALRLISEQGKCLEGHNINFYRDIAPLLNASVNEQSFLLLLLQQRKKPVIENFI